MTVLIADLDREHPDTEALLALGFTYHNARERWECRNLTRQHEAAVRKELPAVGLRFSIPETLVLQLAPKAAHNPEHFWVASNICSRNLVLSTPWDATRIPRAVGAALKEAAKILDVQPAAIRIATYLQARAQEQHDADPTQPGICSTGATS